MGWTEIRRQLREAVGKLRDNNVLDAGTKALLRQIPILGDFAVDLWSSIDAGDEEKTEQLVKLLESAAERQEDFLAIQAVVRDSRDTLLATKASVDVILKEAHATHEAVARIEPAVLRIDARLERLSRLTEARPVSEALRAGAILEQDQDEVSGVLREADAELKESGEELSAESAFHLGLLYAADGRYEDARRCFLAVTKRKPDMAETYAALAMIHQLQANTLIGEENFGLASASLERAQAYAETALQYDSTDSGVLNQMGYTEKELAQRYAAAGRGDEAEGWLDKARSHFKQALGLDPNDASAHNGLGSVALVRGDYQEAIDECTRAVDLRPKYLFAQYDLAGALYESAASDEDPGAKIGTLQRFAQTVTTVFELDGDPEAGRLPPEARERLVQAATAATAWLESLVAEDR